MTVLPTTSPVPQPILIFMPPTSPVPTPVAAGVPPPSQTPLPHRGSGGDAPSSSDAAGEAEEAGSAGAGGSGNKDGGFPKPKLRLEVRDLSHPGSAKFLGAINTADVFGAAVANVQRLLYVAASEPGTSCPPTRSVTLVLRDMGGVAYTTGSELDDDHKEIHFSLGYIDGIATTRLAAEITGVLTHELVHCYQWNAKGSCPGGLIEGIADWVRLKCALSPPHWKRGTDGSWDRGYEHTAYFLEYLEDRYGAGTVRKINESLRVHRYEEKRFWTELVGRPIDQLYQDYVDKFGGSTKKVDEGTQT